MCNGESTREKMFEVEYNKHLKLSEPEDVKVTAISQKLNHSFM